MNFNPIMLALIPATLFGLGTFTTLTNPEIQESRTLQKQTAQNRAQARVEARQGEANSTLAENRYSSGNCLLSDTPIEPGLTYVDVPVGVYVCDRHGWTAQIDGSGTVDKLAYTSNANVIRGFLGW